MFVLYVRSRLDVVVFGKWVVSEASCMPRLAL
jgi:hypothetical protein